MGRKNPIAGVYMLICGTTGKVYIGETGNLVDRYSMYKHTEGRPAETISRPIDQAITEYGFGDFTFIALETTETNPRLAEGQYRRKREAKYIRKYNATDTTVGYNVLPSSQVKHHRRKTGPGTGYAHSERTKIKKSNPIIACNTNDDTTEMYLGAQSFATVHGTPDHRIDRSMIIHALQHGKSWHGYFFFPIDIKKRREVVARVINSNLSAYLLNRYLDALKMSNRFCEQFGYAPLYIDLNS